MQEKPICVAVVPRIDKRYKEGYRLQSFHHKSAFIDFVENLHGMIVGDSAKVILSGGSHQTITVAEASAMEWIFETP